mgnify:CR=1 FL=1
MKPKKKDKNYIPILDQPIEELKKSTGQSVDFDAAMTQILKDSGKQKGQK